MFTSSAQEGLWHVGDMLLHLRFALPEEQLHSCLWVQWLTEGGVILSDARCIVSAHTTHTDCVFLARLPLNFSREPSRALSLMVAGPQFHWQIHNSLQMQFLPAADKEGDMHVKEFILTKVWNAIYQDGLIEKQWPAIFILYFPKCLMALAFFFRCNIANKRYAFQPWKIPPPESDGSSPSRSDGFLPWQWRTRLSVVRGFYSKKWNHLNASTATPSRPNNEIGQAMWFNKIEPQILKARMDHTTVGKHLQFESSISF